MTIMSETQSSENISSQSNHSMQNMIEFIARQNVYFKSQQLGEPDFTFVEKKTIVQQLFDSNKSLFLQRYGQYLDLNHLKCFDSIDHDDDVVIQVRDLKSRLDLNAKMIRNRRYRAMEDMLENGDYFSNSEMQSRNPYLFDLMVGQHLTDLEQKQLQADNYKSNYDQINFSSFLMEQMRVSRLTRKYFAQKHDEENVDESDEEEQEDEDNDDIVLTDEENKSTITDEEKDQLNKEFRNQMIRNFLDGKDCDFDYNKVDNDDRYDNEELERYEQEKYFSE